MLLALAGNQNCGKTTLFNRLTGANRHVGNFPGVTVDAMSGTIRGTSHTVADLPGIYSIRPFSDDEKVARDFLTGHIEGIINVADVGSISRGLYLTLQLLELEKPTVLALNMMDELRAGGGSVDTARLSAILGIPVIPISAASGEGVDELIQAAVRVTEKKLVSKTDVCQSELGRRGSFHRCVHAIRHLIEDHAAKLEISPRFAASCIIEGDEEITRRLGLSEDDRKLIENALDVMENEYGSDRLTAMASTRYEFIDDAVKKCVKRPSEGPAHEKSVKLDKILTGRYTAIPVFILVMLTVFYLTFDLIGGNLSELLSNGIDICGEAIGEALAGLGASDLALSLIVDGIFAGVGAVIGFLPIIITLFFCLSLLEDTGYIARIAFVADRLMRKLGLSGRSIVPMLIGFGCTVPAAMATRTLPSEKDRKVTLFLTPYMSCSAKIPIYAFFSAAFFPEHSVWVMSGMYLLGIVVGIVAALLMKRKREEASFVTELPDYRLPTLKTTGLLLWDKARDFITRAFTIIFAASVIIWFLRSFDPSFTYVSDSSLSLLASAGNLIAPVFAPLGFGGWEASTALIAGLAAKESVVSTLEVLTNGVSGLFTTASALSYLTFTLLYTPCVAAIAAVKRELKSGFAAFGVVLTQCGVAWVVSFVVYRIALLLT